MSDGPALDLITGGEDEAITDPPAAEDFTPCTSKNVWCKLPDGHKGRCMAYPDGNRPPKRSAGAGSNRAVQRSRRTSKPTMAPAVLGMAYGQIGAMIEATAPEPTGPPIGRVMQFQAPLAGQQLDALLANLPIYKRVTTMGSNAVVEQLASLLIAPLLAGLMAANERAAMTLYPIFASAIKASAVEIVKAQKAQVAALEQIDEYTEEADELTRQFMEAMFARRDEPAHDQAGPDA